MTSSGNAMSPEPRFATLVDLFEQAVQSFGPRDLFGTKAGGRWTWTTYAEFGRDVDKLRGGLSKLGIGRGDAVAIVANNRVEWAVAAYACFGLGASYVPMYEAESPKEWEFIVRDCEAKLVFVGGEGVLSKARGMLDTIPTLRTLVVLGDSRAHDNGVDGRVVSYASVIGSGNTVASIRPAPGDLAALIYTSGTTGNPKGVILTHGNIASNVSAAHEVFPMELADRSLSFLPWAHVFGQTAELHTLISCGASMAICEGVDKILDNLAEVQPTLLFSVPRIFNRIYTAVQEQIASRPKVVRLLVAESLKVTAKERRGERLGIGELALLKTVDRVVFSKVRARFGGKLKYAISGGAALATEVAEFIDSLGILVFEGYGLTETSPVVSTNIPGARKIGSVGRPLPGVRVEIDPATAERKPASGDRPAHVEGEIVVHGPNVMKGYLKRPEENAAVLTRDGGFRTGDKGFVDAQGFLYITGRIKEQYKLENGKYVVPTPLEEQIKLSPYVLNAMVYGDNKPYNVAIVVANVAAVRKWAEASQLHLPGSDDAVLADLRVRNLFEKEIETHAGAFKGFESIRDFALIASDFTVEGGFLTPSLKLKRRKVLEVYGPLVDRLYAQGKGARQPSAGARA
jgi:long-chain acyl-CoA synthetase